MDSAFHDLPADAFPVTIRFIREDTMKVCHTVVITEPGAVHVPPLAKQLGTRIGVNVTYANGGEWLPTGTYWPEES